MAAWQLHVEPRQRPGGLEESLMYNIVSVRWFDGYMEEFQASEVRFGGDLLFLRLTDGKNRHIPLRHVRWFGMSRESHQGELDELLKGVRNETTDH